MIAILKKFRVLFHPIFVFVVAQVSWALLMFVWIRWYLSRSKEFEELMRKLGVSPDLESGQWIILLEGCILMGILLVALYLVFVSFRRQVRLNRLQDSFLSSVTHELKTPLASIRLYTETLLRHDLTQEEQKSFLNRNLQEVSRLQALVDRILLSAKLQSRHSLQNKAPVALNSIVMQSWNKLKERHGQKRCFEYVEEKTGSREPEWDTIPGVEHELSILFDNLFDNAAKYTEQDGKIRLVLRHEKDAIQYSVIDDGIGLERSQFKKVFKKFYRAADAEKVNVKGSGLGLSVAAAIAKAHNGTLTASSKGTGKGTTFHVRFKTNSPSR